MEYGQKILEKAKKIIPGGNQLLSKRSEIFLPKIWPNYYSKSKGCFVWDLKNKKYYDFAGMGVTSCVLGYADHEVNKKVKLAINNGSMSTLNSLEEVSLAKKLLELHKWAEMAKFCKSGGEACMVAIRIARAFTNKQNIAFCGYHGWHDWYLAANLNNKKNLDKQLLPGLSTKGVSNTFKGTMFPFFYNDLASFKKSLSKKNNIGLVIMEPMRGEEPKKNFLKEIRKITKKNNILLIFDEITSGFHENFGGLHLKYNIRPDIAIFGKALGNGYPISAILGKKKIMSAAQNTFISSTMWTENIGFSAANATLNKMKQHNVQKKLVLYGKKIKKGWLKSAKKHGLNIKVSGLDSIPSLKFNYKNHLEISTFFTQEMLKKGFLANTTLATTFAYNDKIINKYLNEIDKFFLKLKKTMEKKEKIPLNGPIKHDTFRRLTK